MTFKSIMTTLLITQLALVITLASPAVNASSDHDAPVEEHIEKGPNNGRMLTDGDFAIELAIVEAGVPPEFRVFATKGGNPVSAKEVTVNVKLTRLGDVIDDINFSAEKNYLRGDMVVYEPHSFIVSLTASYQGKHHHWTYDNLEGRTTIGDAMAESMGVETQIVGAQTMTDTLKVYGKLKLAANAVRHISARYPGEVKTLEVVLGQRVKKGQLLFTIESNESLQSYKVYAPISGIVTSQDTGVGELARDNRLLTITDTTRLVAELSVFPMDQANIKADAPATLFIPGTEQVINTQLFDSLIELNQDQAKIFRAEVNNPDGKLSVGQFVSADISLSTYQVGLAVKASGLQAFRDFTVVYAKVGEEYEVRMLELGRRAGPWVEVLGGITAGTEYVTENSYLVKADIEKSGASHDH